MKKSVLAARLLLGAVFLVFGVNTVCWSFGAAIFQPPDTMPEPAARFQQALTETGFMHPLRGTVEALGGLMLLTGILVPLGLLLLSPVLVHVVAYHWVLDPAPGGRVFTGLLMCLALFLVWAYWPSFQGLLTSRARSST